jgi:hypothetical protein
MIRVTFEALEPRVAIDFGSGVAVKEIAEAEYGSFDVGQNNFAIVGDESPGEVPQLAAIVEPQVGR